MYLRPPAGEKAFRSSLLRRMQPIVIRPGITWGCGPVYADARGSRVFQAEEAGPYISPGVSCLVESRGQGRYLPRTLSRNALPVSGIPFLLLVAVIASASDGKNGERIALRTKNGYPHILFGYYHPVRAVRFFFLRP